MPPQNLNKPLENGLPAPYIVPRDEHGISRKDISNSALKVLYRLNQAGFDAFLVGGSVRDLLLGQHPKDFDVSTNATPEEIKQLFGNARIIGRRFRIVHVRFGKEIIEVATFRACHGTTTESNADAIQSDSGLLLRDNVYGTLEEDAIRRDFTINALYYTVNNFLVHDYTNGIRDLKNGIISIIGDPVTRYREDPVRMLRAIRFAAKLNFVIAEETAAPIASLAKLLNDIPPARLFDEVLKLFLSGYATNVFKLLCDYQLFQHLFPSTYAHLTDPFYRRFIEQACINTDNRIHTGKYVTPAFLFAVFLWPEMREQTSQLQSSEIPKTQVRQEAYQLTIQRQLIVTSIPKRFSIPMREIWDLQRPLENIQAKNILRTLEHKRFRAAYDFLLLREQAGEDVKDKGEWWTRFQHASSEEQDSMTYDLKKSAKHSARNKRKRRKPPRSMT